MKKARCYRYEISWHWQGHEHGMYIGNWLRLLSSMEERLRKAICTRVLPWETSLHFAQARMPNLFTDSSGYIRTDYDLHAKHLDEEEPRPRRKLPIPDLRFEQTYLSRIRGCLHIEPQTAPISEDGDYIAVTHVVPLINPSQQVISIDWWNVAYITWRDQVMMPLLQGILWWVVLAI